MEAAIEDEMLMGLFSKLLGLSGQKESLIRRLLRNRISQDPSAASYGQSPDFADKMPTLMLMGTPEATIVTCVETWAKLKQSGQVEAAIANRIASLRHGPSHRASVEAVIRDRVQAEHGHSGFLPAEHVDWCIREAKITYGIG